MLVAAGAQAYFAEMFCRDGYHSSPFVGNVLLAYPVAIDKTVASLGSVLHSAFAGTVCSLGPRPAEQVQHAVQSQVCWGGQGVQHCYRSAWTVVHTAPVLAALRSALHTVRVPNWLQHLPLDQVC